MDIAEVWYPHMDISMDISMDIHIHGNPASAHNVMKLTFAVLYVSLNDGPYMLL